MISLRTSSLALASLALLGAAGMAPGNAAAAEPGSTGEPFEFSSPSAVTRAGGLTGRSVETRDGEELGRIHDFALDLGSARIAYVVVSVGSFLIEDSLIAVAPDALRESADPDGRLVLEADAQALSNARRFSAGDWPVRADVLASPGEGGSGQPPGDDAAQAEDAASRRGSATISSDRKTATLSAGERSIRVEERPRPPAPARPAPVPAMTPEDMPAPDSRFGRLDDDGDGLLNRAEIAHELTRSDSYSDIDLDGNGIIDPVEFETFVESRASAGSEAP